MVDAGRSHNPYVEPKCSPPRQAPNRHKTRPQKQKQNYWHGFRTNQRRTRSTKKRPRRKPAAHRKRPNKVWHFLVEDQATFWQRPGKDLAQFGKDQAETWHNLVKSRQRPGTIWQRPGKDLAQFGKAQAETWHNLEKTKRSLAQLGKRAILAQQQNGNMTAQGTCRTKKYTQHKHSGRGVPSCGMAERPRGLPQRSRKPRPSNTTKHNPTGKRRRNTNRGVRRYGRTKKKKESSEDVPSQPGAEHVIVAAEGTPCPGRPGPAGRDRNWPTKTHAEQHIPDSDKQPRRQRHNRYTQRVQ